MLLYNGCVQRRIRVTSRPTGALVYLNDEEVGRTPITVPFTFYGTYDVRLLLDGHQPVWTTREARAPWWEAPGPDLVAEAIPDGRSDIAWHFDLEPSEELDEQGIVQRANQLQRQASN